MFLKMKYNPIQLQLLSQQDPVKALEEIGNIRLGNLDNAISYFGKLTNTLTNTSVRSGLLAQKEQQAVNSARAAGYSLAAAETSDSLSQLARQDKKAMLYERGRRDMGVSSVEADIKNL